MSMEQHVVEEIKSGKIKTRQQLENRKRELSKKYKTIIPTNAAISKAASFSHKLLVTKPVRSLSGVSVVAIMTKPQPCPGECIYCPQGNSAKSYTGFEPAAMRAEQADFDSYKQTQNRVIQLQEAGHPTSKIEAIIMGATFTAMEKQYQEEFLLGFYNALNNSELSSVEEAKQANETAVSRCVGLTFEVRPDFCKQQDINAMLGFGCTRVELGVQTIYDDVYKKIKRGHNVKSVVDATAMLKDSFLKVGYHLMPGLPFSTREKDIEMFKQVFSDQRFKPDMLKIYPCMLAKKEFYKNTEIFDLYNSGEWNPLNTDKAAEIIANAKRFFPKWVRVMRIQRDIPLPYIEAGVDASNLREVVQKQARDLLGIECNCIRCREVRDAEYCEPELKRLDYTASNGQEVFLSFEANNKVLGLLRLRNPNKPFRKEITDHTVGIRELHVYGQEAKVGSKGAVQHKGLGSQLVAQAELISKQEFDAHELVVMSGVGVKEYYKSLGFSKKGVYMAKKL